MKKKIVVFLIIIFNLNLYSQISFENGYYIDNSNQKIECIIKNLDWKNNPTGFKYKLSKESETEVAEIKYIKEFGIYNNSKFIRSAIKIDKSSDNINNLDYDRNPVFIEEVLFLKVLVEGKANLYIYEKESLKRYFYSTDNSDIEQLIFKLYLDVENKILTNNKFKHQLWTDLKCPKIEIDKVENLEYKTKSLINFFVEYNKCINLEFINYDQKVKNDLFNLSFRIHLNNSSLSIENKGFTDNIIDFGNKTSIGFGIETEFIFPYNKNKWAIIVEPTYQNFKAEIIADVNNISGGKLISNVDYTFVEVPIGVRHYFFINNDSKIFINASYIFAFNIKSSIEFKRADNSNFNSVEINSRNNVGFGLGYKFKDKYSLEMRYRTSRNILGDYVFWKSNYNTIAVMIGYSIF